MRISISATDEVLNYKDMVASFATGLSACLASTAVHEVTKHLMPCHGHRDGINAHIHRHGEIMVSFSHMIRLFGAEIPP